MSQPQDLLAEAERLLAGEVTVGKANDPRAACWVARTALERAVADLLEQQACPAGESSMRSRLSCLEFAYAHKPDLVRSAMYAWAGLSNACHHHAFELSPSYTEARHLVNLVHELARAAAA